jgi:hypothetical protein
MIARVVMTVLDRQSLWKRQSYCQSLFFTSTISVQLEIHIRDTFFEIHMEAKYVLSLGWVNTYLVRNQVLGLNFPVGMFEI